MATDKDNTQPDYNIISGQSSDMKAKRDPRDLPVR